MPTREELTMLQALPLELKVERTRQRIREWVDHWGKDHVYVSFSGGKDSTVLLHIVRDMYGDGIPAVFVNTGLEFPEIQRFVRKFPNVVVLTPEMNFREVLTRCGYPVISKEVSTCVEETRKWCSKNLNVERESNRQKSNETVRGRANDAEGCAADVRDWRILRDEVVGYRNAGNAGGGDNCRAFVPDDILQLLGTGPYTRGKRESVETSGEDVRRGDSGGGADEKGEYP